MRVYTLPALRRGDGYRTVSYITRMNRSDMARTLKMPRPIIFAHDAIVKAIHQNLSGDALTPILRNLTSPFRRRASPMWEPIWETLTGMTPQAREEYLGV